MSTSVDLASPLFDTHRRLGARWFEREETNLVADYGDLRAEYLCLTSGAGMADLTCTGILRVQGRDRIEWLHKLVTTDIHALRDGAGAYGLLLNATGHVAADFVLLRLPDALILYADPRATEVLLTRLRRAIFRENVTVQDLRDQWTILTLQGAATASIVERWSNRFGLHGPFEHLELEFEEQSLILVRNARTGLDGVDFLVPRTRATNLWEALRTFGACPIGWSALNLARMEAGIGWYGEDFDHDILAPEARLDRFIAQNKGCYTGQEVIARIRNRGHVNRILVQFKIEGETIPERGASVFSDEREIGWITSAAWSYSAMCPLALGFVRKDFAQTGQKVWVSASGVMKAGTVLVTPYMAQSS